VRFQNWPCNVQVIKSEYFFLCSTNVQFFKEKLSCKLNKDNCYGLLPEWMSLNVI